MTELTTKLLKDAARLSDNERLKLIDHLLDSVTPTDDAVAVAWTTEANDRLDAYLRGEIASVPAADVLAKHRRH